MKHTESNITTTVLSNILEVVGTVATEVLGNDASNTVDGVRMTKPVVMDLAALDIQNEIFRKTGV